VVLVRFTEFEFICINIRSICLFSIIYTYHAFILPRYTGKNDITRRVTHREAVFGTVIHSIFDACHYEVLWTYALTRLL
jgi:hypothetical protein